MRLISPASENLHIRGGSTKSKPRLLDLRMLPYFCGAIFSERRRVARRRVFDSNRARALFVENPKTLLRIDRHVENENWTSNKPDPRLFSEGLKSCKVPELTLLHRNLGDLVIEHPIAKHGQPALFGVAEHGLWQSFFHRLVSLDADRGGDLPWKPRGYRQTPKYHAIGKRLSDTSARRHWPRIGFDRGNDRLGVRGHRAHAPSPWQVQLRNR